MPHLLILPQVLLAGAECLLRLRLSEGAQGTAHLLLHQRVLVSDSVQQNGGQLCSDKARAHAQAGLMTRPSAEDAESRRPTHRTHLLLT